jgi:hypothetical protein
MKARSGWAFSGWCGMVCLAGCGQGSASPAPDEAGADGRQGDDLGSIDAAPDVVMDAPGEAASDATHCSTYSGRVVCCCAGDIGMEVVCPADGGPRCAGPPDFPASQFRIYYDEDCTRPCGPCSIACPDTGSPPVDAGGDAWFDANL